MRKKPKLNQILKPPKYLSLIPHGFGLGYGKKDVSVCTRWLEENWGFFCFLDLVAGFRCFIWTWKPSYKIPSCHLASPCILLSAGLAQHAALCFHPRVNPCPWGGSGSWRAVSVQVGIGKFSLILINGETPNSWQVCLRVQWPESCFSAPLWSWRIWRVIAKCKANCRCSDPFFPCSAFLPFFLVCFFACLQFAGWHTWWHKGGHDILSWK